MGAAETCSGLEIMLYWMKNNYEAGIEVSQEEVQSLNIFGDSFHPEWNYIISPQVL